MDVPMDRPYVVCHMLTSLDGKIDGGFFSSPDCLPALQEYGRLRETFRCQATLYGTTTMLGGYAKGRVGPLPKVGSLPEADAAVSREDFSAPYDTAHFLVSLDPEGVLAFDGPVSTRKGRAPAHIIEVLTDKASDAYLAYLRGLGISYLFAGKENIDCALLLRKLKTHFGVERLMVAGGGVTNCSFASENLLDELSVVVAPVADGGTEAVSIFEAADGRPSLPVPFALGEIRILSGGSLWLRYRNKHRHPEQL